MASDRGVRTRKHIRLPFPVCSEDESQGEHEVLVIGPVITSPAAVLMADEREAYLQSRIIELRVVSEINVVASELHNLYRERVLGRGPDPLWSLRVHECDTRLDALFDKKRQVIARRTWILQAATHRLRNIKR